MRFKGTAVHHFLYLVSGSAHLSTGDIATTGDLIRIDKGFDLAVFAKEDCDLVEIEVIEDPAKSGK